MITMLITPTKSTKISTTIRLDKKLREEIQKFTNDRHIDFTTFIDLSLRDTLVRGIRLEPRMSDEKYEYYRKMADDIDTGKESVHGPFEGKEAIDFLKQYM